MSNAINFFVCLISRMIGWGGGGSRGVITVFMLFWFPVSQVVGIVTIAHTQIKGKNVNRKIKIKH